MLSIMLALLAMAGFFLLLLGAVGFVQDKKFFSPAPKAIRDAVPQRKNRFPGAHAIGWALFGAAQGAVPKSFRILGRLRLYAAACRINLLPAGNPYIMIEGASKNAAF